MLQQTQVKTVIPYFIKFTKKYKTLKSFSKSSEKKTLKLWEGLGYYRRARNLLAASKILVPTLLAGSFFETIFWGYGGPKNFHSNTESKQYTFKQAIFNTK